MEKTQTKNIHESAKVAVSGAEVAKDACKSLEKLGCEVISSKNAKQLGKRNDTPFLNDDNTDDK